MSGMRAGEQEKKVGRFRVLMQVDDRTEIQVVEAARGGCLESFGELCSRYYNAMAAVAWSLLRDHQLAEDAAQETFARALRNIRKLEGSDRFGAWLAAICRNVSKDMRDARKGTVELEAEYQMPAESTEDVGAGEVRRAIWELGDEDRETIVLRYYNELSQEKMGEVLGISRSAANRRLKKAQERLARILGRYGFGEIEI